nr:hypothetical protein [Marinicella sp. W31]MDC2876739.1 hypothetical protein [Marinicella sp. W31]
MKKATFYTILFSITPALTPLSGAVWAHEPLYKNGQQIFLVAPDGRQLDYIPEYGSVVMGTDADGRQILLDSNNNLVATEMSAREYGQYRDGGYPRPPNSGWGSNDRQQNGRVFPPRRTGPARNAGMKARSAVTAFRRHPKFRRQPPQIPAEPRKPRNPAQSRI